MEAGVEHVHRGRAEVGGVETVPGCGTGNGEPLIDGAAGRVVDGDNRVREGHCRVPAQDCALLGDEDEAGGALLRAPEHASHSAPRTATGAPRRRRAAMEISFLQVSYQHARHRRAPAFTSPGAPATSTGAL